jgi:hypothetical protein
MFSRRFASRILAPALAVGGVAAIPFASKPALAERPRGTEPYVNLPQQAHERTLPAADHKIKLSGKQGEGAGTVALPIPPRATPALISESEYEGMAEGVPRGKESANTKVDTKLPRIAADWTHFPQVPPPIGKSRGPAHIVMEMDTTVERMPLTPSDSFDFWCVALPSRIRLFIVPCFDSVNFFSWLVVCRTYNGKCPGPFIRCKVGDVVEIQYANKDKALAHNIDFHAVSGPGGGAPALFVEPEQKRTGTFKVRLLSERCVLSHQCASPITSVLLFLADAVPRIVHLPLCRRPRPNPHRQRYVRPHPSRARRRPPTSRPRVLCPSERVLCRSSPWRRRW